MPIFPGNNVLWYPERVITDLQPRPAKAKAYLTAYKKNGARISDHRQDYPCSWMRNSYSKRQPWNCDKTFIVLQSNDGYWHLYDARSLKYVRRLAGPAGDNAEVQWDRSDPKVLYYGEVNGGTRIYRLDVTTNIHTVQYDFTADVRALWPTAVHCWSGSEGSPACGSISLCGKLWGFKAEDAGFNILGYFVMDIFARQIVWHKAETVRPDHVSLTPSGKWFIYDHGQEGGTFAVNLQTNETKQLHHGLEHDDYGILPNGHDFYVAIDYQTNDGDMFWIDLEDPLLTRHVFDHAYHNPMYGSNYAFHFSAKAYRKPGFVVVSNLGAPPCNMYIMDLVGNKKYPFAANYGLRAQYFDEPHACPDPDLTAVIHNDNYGVTGDIDAYVTYIPPLTP